jgi:hypothetical protein
MGHSIYPAHCRFFFCAGKAGRQDGRPGRRGPYTARKKPVKRRKDPKESFISSIEVQPQGDSSLLLAVRLATGQTMLPLYMCMIGSTVAWGSALCLTCLHQVQLQNGCLPDEGKGTLLIITAVAVSSDYPCRVDKINGLCEPLMCEELVYRTSASHSGTRVPCKLMTFYNSLPAASVISVAAVSMMSLSGALTVTIIGSRVG